ncbi:MAG TPA: protoporphyrinogen oxidase [Planococcus sp. (in: firmicutes)]|nr:protoporphyrinogen oxidase [Planococcus sp. (in: firmicutes)]
MEKTRKIVIVGGGITGLSAAYHLQKQSKKRQIPIDLTVIEATHRMGGAIQTVRKDGFVIERGPDSFLSLERSVDGLAESLGIQDRLLTSTPGQTYVVVEDQLHKIPSDFILGVPTAYRSFLTADVISWSGKVRAAGDILLPKASGTGDIGLGKFMRRRFGNELVENLIEPLLSGIYAGDIDKISLQAAFPLYYEVEREHRSLILGLKKLHRENHPSAVSIADVAGRFQSFQNGLETLVKALEADLADCDLLKGVKVQSFKRAGDGLILSLNNDSTVIADEVVFALPHSKAQTIFKPHGLLEDLKEMPATSVATVVMAFPEEALDLPAEGSGFSVSRNSDCVITACTWLHKKWPFMAPPGKALLKCNIGRVGDEAVVDLSDKEIEKIVLTDLKKLISIEGEPLFTIVSRFKETMPQYFVGHHERISKAQGAVEEAFPMIQLIGCSYRGSSIPECIAQGEKAAERIFNRWEASV